MASHYSLEQRFSLVLDCYKSGLSINGWQSVFAGYNKLKRFRRCCCYAHLRRYFIEAIPKGHEKDFTDPGVQGMLYCNKLFEWGDEIGYSVIQQMELMPARQITCSMATGACSQHVVSDISYGCLII